MSNGNPTDTTALLFEDKLGLGRYGGMAVAVTAVSQVAEQFTGLGLYVALTFSFLIAVYYARRAAKLPLFECVIWVPIYGCTLFITSLGSNNVVGTTQEKSKFQQARAAYESTLLDYQQKLKAQNERLRAYETALEKSQKVQEIYRKLIEAKSPDINLSSAINQPQLKRTTASRILGAIVGLLRPGEAYAQATDPPSAGTPETLGPGNSEQIRQLLLQLKVLKTEQQEAIKVLEKKQVSPQPAVTPKPDQVPQNIEPKIWKTW